MGFDLPPVRQGSVWLLELWHQIATRDYYPYRGRVALDLALNGTPFQRVELITRSESFAQEFELPTTHLRDGRNEVVIRLAETATTTHRIHVASILDRRQL